MELDAKIYVAGHLGMVGSAITRRLERAGHTNLLLRTRLELDLTDQSAVESFFAETRPEFVFLAAAKVGGIHANSTFPATFIRDNLAIQTNVIHAAHRNGVRKLLFLGSSCIYPRDAPQPIREDTLLTGPLEPTNEPYAIAKIAGVVMCQSYRREYGFDAICAMPTNLYGPGDNYDPENSHVIPGLVYRLHGAKVTCAEEVSVWGSGRPLREFLHVDDLADASMLLMQQYSDPAPINVGSGEEISISDLARLIAGVVGYKGRIRFDTTRPDGTPRKRLDTSRLEALGWRSGIGLKEGLVSTYREFRDQH